MACVDVDQLGQVMWDADAPYEKVVTPLGAVGLRAAGRSAIVLSEWLVGLFNGAQGSSLGGHAGDLRILSRRCRRPGA